MVLPADFPAAQPTSLLYEAVPMKDSELPINVTFRKSSSQDGGCWLHWHEELEFYYIKQGGVSLLCNGNKDWLYPGDVAFVNWCAPHRGNGFLDGTEHYIIQIGPKLFSDEVLSCHLPGISQGQKENLLLLLISQSANLPRILHNCTELNALLDSIIWEEENKQPGYEMKIKAAVLNILVFLIRSADFSSHSSAVQAKDLASLEHLKKVLAFLSLHYTNPQEVALPALSKRFGLSVPYLCRIFKKHTTLTLTAYVNELRCSRAAALIQDGISLEDVAARTGFHDYNYFSRLFKKTMGISPSAYRKESEHI